MSNRTVDIVARLQLRAEQFSSESGKRFAEMSANARRAADDVRSTFSSSFAEVNRLARTAIDLPRTATGGLDLSGEIASLKSAALASDQRAAALRELSVAQASVAGSGRAVVESMRLEADASRVAALAEQEAAGAIRQRIRALEAVQAELARTGGATQLYLASTDAATRGTARNQQGVVMLGQQFQDFAVQVSSGQSAFVAFAQQAPQAGLALRDFEGKLGAVGAFLTGGWGTALTVGLVALTPFVAKLFEGGNALEDAVKKLREKASATEIDRQANEIWSKSVDGQVAAMKELNKELERQLKTTQQLQDEKLSEARGQLAATLYGTGKAGAGGLGQASGELASAQRDLRLLRARRDSAFNSAESRGTLESSIRAAEARVKDLQANVDRLAANANEARETVRRAEIVIAERKIEAALDGSTAATERYALALGKLREERQRDAISQAEFERRGLALRQQRDREVKAARDAKRPSAGAAASDVATPASIAKLLRSALPGVQITSTTGGRHVAGSDHYKGGAIDFVPRGGMSSLGKDDIRRIFETAGIPIRRNAKGVEQLFGPGDKGHANHFHVAWEKGKFALDNYNASVRDAAKAERELEQAQRELESALEGLIGRYDPAAAAAGRYRAELAEIAKLQAAGKIGVSDAIGFQAAAKSAYDSTRLSAANDDFRRIAGPEQVDRALDEFDARIRSASEAFGQDIRSAADTFRDGVVSAADLLGVRVSGPLARVLQPGGIEGQSREVADSIGQALSRNGIEIGERSLGRISGALSSVAYGQFGGSVFSSITGGKQSPLASGIGGILGKEVGKSFGPAISSAIGGTLGKTLGGAAGPLGSIVGGILGNVAAGLFTKAKYATAGVTFSNGALDGGKATGNSGSRQTAVSGVASTVAKGVNAIVDQLGATITGAPTLTLGTYKDKFRVSTTGYQGKLDFKGASGRGLYDFGKDEKAAIEFAIKTTLTQSIITGISQASVNIIKSGQDLEAAITKAGLIEAVPRDLKAALDPVGAAIDELNRKFQRTVDALKEGGASAEQMAQAQRLYDLQLADVKNSTESASQSLKDFLADLKVGPNSPYSLRDQRSQAQAALQPFLQQINAGQRVDVSKYQAAAQTALDIERQIYGSTQGFFDFMDLVQGATNKAIGAIDNVEPISPAVESPFAKATASATASTASGVQTSNELLAQLSQQMAGLNAAVAMLGGGGGSGSGFIGGGGRAFTAAQVAMR
jgi:hypothetical protein